MGAVSLRLPDDVAARLQTLADKTGRSKTFYMVEAINAHLDDLEDLYLAERRWAEIQSGSAQTMSLDAVVQGRGLAD